MSARTVQKNPEIAQFTIDDSGTFKKAPSKFKQYLYGIYVLSITILLSIFIVANIQLMMGTYSSGTCVLFYTLAENSPLCAVNANAGFIAIAATITLALVRVLYIRNSKSPGKVITMVLALLHTCLTIVAVCFAIIYTFGINQTCKWFSPLDCKTQVFGKTFRDRNYFIDGNLVVNAAIVSIWIVTGSFAGFASYEWIKYRKFN